MAKDPFSNLSGTGSAIGNLFNPNFTPTKKRETLLATKYKTPSFRGVPFFLSKVESGFGQRTVNNEYPKRDLPYVESLGRKAHEYTFDAYVLGEDYESARDALIAACEKVGPGELVHPYFGKVDVICINCRVKEQNDTLGMAAFTLTFQEAGKLIWPALTVDAQAVIATSAGALTAASAANFATIFNQVLNAPSYVVSVAKTRVGMVSDLVNSIAGTIKGVLQKTNDFSYGVKNLKAQVANIFGTPAVMAQEINDTINLLSSIVPGNTRTPATNAFLSLANTTPITFQLMDQKTGIAPLTVLPISTTQNAILLTNMETALANHVARCAIAQAAIEAAASVYLTLNDAQFIQNAITAQLDAMASSTADNPSLLDMDDNIYQSLIDLRAKVFASIPPPDQSLPQLATFTPLTALPSLVIAYKNYGTVSFVIQNNGLSVNDDLVSRNKIRHPGFIPAAIPIKILKGAGIPS